MRSRVAPALLLAAALAPGPLHAAPRLVDSLVAVVGDEPLLRSDVERELLLTRAEEGRELSAPASDDELQHTLDALVDRVVVVQEARRLALFAPSRDEIAAERTQRTAGSPGLPQAWRGRGWSEVSLDDCLARRLQAARYVESRARFGASRPALPRRSDEASSPHDAPAPGVATELRRRVRVLVVGFAVGARAGMRTSGRVSAPADSASGKP